MPDQFEDVYLARDALDVRYFRDFAFLQYFDCDGLAGRFVYRRLDFTKSALADGLA